MAMAVIVIAISLIEIISSISKVRFMKHKIFCQSCYTQMDSDEHFGTESDGSYNRDYCWHCYQNGAFTNPFITLNEMQNHVRHIMERHQQDNASIFHAINLLPELKRWYKPARI
jgi:hypothetical protein